MSSPVTIQASDESILCSIKQLSETFGNASIALIDADNVACEHNVLANLSDTCRLLGDALTESGRLDNLLSGFIIELLKAGQADDAALLVKEQDNLSKPHALMLVSMLSLLNYESSPEFIPLVYVRRSFDVIVSLLSDIRVSLETVVSLAQQGHSLMRVTVLGGPHHD